MDHALIDVVAETLSASLSPDQNTRVAAELRLSELLKNGETGVALAALLTSPERDLTLRQMTGTILQRKFILDHWSPFFPSFKGHAPSVELKEQIRTAVFHGLSDPERRIRSASGYALSTIAQSDWPDECPDLLTSLITLLSSGTPDGIDGAMRVFAELTKSELSEEQLLPVLRSLLPVLMNILGSPDHHSPLTRARVLTVFNQCIEVLYMVKDQHTDAVKEATETILPSWLNALKVLLDIDIHNDIASSSNWDALSVRLQVFKVLERITYCFPRAISATIPAFFASAVSNLEKLLPVYQTYYVAPDGPTPPGTSEDPNETDVLSKLGTSAMEFTKVVCRTKAAKAWLASEGAELIPALLACAVGWTQMTTEDESEWATDANAFVADDNDEEAWTVRSVGFDVVTSLMEAAPAITARALQLVVERTIQESNQAKLAGHVNWWKTLEAALATVGSASEDLIQCNEDEEDSERPIAFNVQPLLIDVIPPLLSLGDFPFLQGRGFVFASQFSSLLPASLFSQYLGAAIEALESPVVPMPVKVSSVKAIQNFSSQSGAKDVITPQASRICADLTPFLPDATEDALTLIVEALLSVIEMDGSRWLTPELTTPLVVALMDVWVKNVKDPILLSLLSDVFVAIAKCPVPGVYQTIVTHSLPTLAQALSSESWIVSSATDLITSLIKGAPQGQLGEGFFAVLGPALFASLREAEDREVIQNGIECLTLIIRKGCDQLLSYVSPTTGETGLALLMQLIASNLAPTSSSEAGGLYIGDMIVHLLKSAGGTDEVRGILPQLLTALVNRMESAKTAPFIQSLIIPFAYLIHTQRDDVLSLLESVPNGLNVLINVWCENAETFQGHWAPRMSTIALCDLFTSNRASLQGITVKGDMIIRPETANVIMTRSRTKQVPTEYTSIPFHVRVLKLLVNELKASGENALAAASGKDAEVDLEGDDEAEEWAEEEDLFQGLKQEEMGFLSQYLDDAAGADDGDATPGDEDMQDDPISQLDMRTHLLGFLRQCAQADPQGFSNLVDELNAEEILIVRRAING